MNNYVKTAFKILDPYSTAKENVQQVSAKQQNEETIGAMCSKHHVPYCRVLPPDKFNGMITQPLPICSKSFTMTRQKPKKQPFFLLLLKILQKVTNNITNTDDQRQSLTGCNCGKVIRHNVMPILQRNALTTRYRLHKSRNLNLSCKTIFQ